MAESFQMYIKRSNPLAIAQEKMKQEEQKTHQQQLELEALKIKLEILRQEAEVRTTRNA